MKSFRALGEDIIVISIHKDVHDGVYTPIVVLNYSNRDKAKPTAALPFLGWISHTTSHQNFV